MPSPATGTSDTVLPARLRGVGAPPVPVQLTLRHLGASARLGRAAVGPLGGLVVAVAVLPVPIIHLVLPPIALLGGLAVGIRRGGVRTLFGAARGTCPCCGQEQSLGLTNVAYHLPREVKCHACRQLLLLEAG